MIRIDTDPAKQLRRAFLRNALKHDGRSSLVESFMNRTPKPEGAIKGAGAPHIGDPEGDHAQSLLHAVQPNEAASRWLWASVVSKSAGG